MNTTNEETLDAYNRAVTIYLEKSPQVVSGQLKQWIDDNLSSLEQTAKILEIGSGTGKDAAYFASQGYNVELTDASEGFVKYLREQGYSARILNALSDDLGTDYDMIFADAVFLHFTETELRIVLRKCLDALRKGGRLAFTLKAGKGEESTAQKLGHPRYFHYWQAEDIRELLAASGFSDIAISSDKDFRGEEKPDWLHINAIR